MKNILGIALFCAFCAFVALPVFAVETSSATSNQQVSSSIVDQTVELTNIEMGAVEGTHGDVVYTAVGAFSHVEAWIYYKWASTSVWLRTYRYKSVHFVDGVHKVHALR